MKSPIYLALILLVLVHGSAFGATLYVAPDGHGRACSKAGPCSLDYANNHLTAGDTALLRGGRYKTQIRPANSGRSSKPITYRPYPGETPSIDLSTSLNGGWKKVSGKDGVDAIYKHRAHTNFRVVTENTLAESGRNVMYWNRDLYASKTRRNTCECIERPGDFYVTNGYMYLRTYDSGNPNKHDIKGASRKDAIEVDGKSHVTISGLTIRYVDNFFATRAADHLTVENCTLEYAKSTMRLRGSDHFVLRNNVIRAVGVIGPHAGDVLHVSDGSDYPLIEGNDISYFGHGGVFLYESRHAVVRKNYFHDGFGKTFGTDGKTRYALIEHNRFTDAPTKDVLKLQHAADHFSIGITGQANIFRFNESWANSIGAIFRGGVEAQNYNATGYDTGNAFYHNTVYGNIGNKNYGGLGVAFHNRGTRRPFIANNIIGNSEYYGGRPYISTTSQLGFRGFFDDRHVMNTIAPEIDNNILFSSKSDQVVHELSVAGLESEYPKLAHDNVQAKPRFVKYDEEQPDFRLKPDSPAIDAGRFLTITTNPGAGKHVTVRNAALFSSGYGLIAGDLIRVGNNPPVRINDINYGANVLTVDKRISWLTGEGVTLDYEGAAPDIGAHEFGGNSPLPPPKNLRLSIR